MHLRPFVVAVAVATVTVGPAAVTAASRFAILHTTDVHGWIMGHPHNSSITVGDPSTDDGAVAVLENSQISGS